MKNITRETKCEKFGCDALFTGVTNPDSDYFGGCVIYLERDEPWTEEERNDLIEIFQKVRWHASSNNLINDSRLRLPAFSIFDDEASFLFQYEGDKDEIKKHLDLNFEDDEHNFPDVEDIIDHIKNPWKYGY